MNDTDAFKNGNLLDGKSPSEWITDLNRKRVRDDGLQRVTDLCMAINAVDGTHVTAKYVKQNERVRQTLMDCMLTEADRSYNAGVSLKDLTKAIQAAGWEDQKVVRRKYELAIVEA